MPALPNVPNVLKVQLGWGDAADLKAMSVLHYRYTGGPPSSAQCATMAASIASAMATNFDSLMTAGSSVQPCTVTDLTTASSGQGTGGSVSNGTRAGSALAPATSALVLFGIARRYRGGKPRVYLPLGASGDITGGKWTTAFVTAVTTGWNAFNTAVLAAGSGCSITEHVNVSYVSAGARRTTPVVDTIISSTVPQLVASQRRRNRNQ